jgi:Ca2+:H+ antiporter
MNALIKEIRHTPLLWMLAFVPIVLAVEWLAPSAHTALFVAPVLVLLSYVIGPKPMDLQFWPGAVVMVMIATIPACFITNSGRSAWFIGALLLFIYLILAMTLYVIPPGTQAAA